jgi:competence protein ComEA
MAWLERHQWLAAAAALLVLAAVIALRPSADASPSAQIVFSDTAAAADGAPIRVHVTGAVQRPGVVPLRSGDRLADALIAAGGAATNADMDELNLARRMRDGEQVVIPEKTRRTAAAAPVSTLAPGARLDLNKATEAQLDALPGIGATYAKRIVDSRAVDGPFKSAQDLVDRRIVPRATYEKLRDIVMVSP